MTITERGNDDVLMAHGRGPRGHARWRDGGRHVRHAQDLQAHDKRQARPQALVAVLELTRGVAALWLPALVAALAYLLGVDVVAAQPAAPLPPDPGMVTHEAPATLRPIYSEWTFHVIVGVVAAVAGVLAHRAWSRRRWHRAPAGVVIEAVLVVDLVNSTWLATHHGEELAMRARNVLERRALAAASPQGVTVVENTGDGCMMTFSSVIAAAKAAAKLLRGLHDRPPDMTPGQPLEVRAAIAYGEILLDSRGARHGAAMNKAFRLMSVPGDAFVSVAGEECVTEIPDRNRILIDEDAANELESADVAIRQVGVCRLKGFSGFHRVYEMRWSES